jgi:hypothetical protein
MTGGRAMAVIDEIFHGYLAAQSRILRRRTQERAGRVRQNIGDVNVSNETKNALAETSAQELDGFTGFTDDREGDDQRSAGAGAIQGQLVKFTNDFQWVAQGEALPPTLELCAIDVVRRVVKWVDQEPVDKIIVPPGQKFPDVEAMNEKAPREEWREDLNGKEVGPWQIQYLVYLLNLQALDRYTFVTSTIGGGIAVRDLADKTKWIRRIRKSDNVNAIVTLSDTFMRNRFGGRQRPHFVIVRWIGLDGGLPTATPLALESGTAAPPTQPGVHEVKEPSLSEDLNDEIPDFSKK